MALNEQASNAHIVEAASDDDILDVALLMASVRSNFLSRRAQADALEYALSLRDKGTLLLARVNGTPVGYLAARPVFCREQYICGMYVSPHYRRVSIGSRFIEVTAEKAYQEGAMSVTGVVKEGNEPQLRLLEQQGWIATRMRGGGHSMRLPLPLASRTA